MVFNPKKILGRNNKYIILHEGNNWRLIAACISVIILLAFVSFSKYLLPDSRERMSFKSNSMISFNMLEVTTPEEIYYDKDKNILEFKISERYLSTKDNFRISYSCTSTEYSNGELPMELIQSDFYTKSDSEVVSYKETMIQVRVPKDFYYITVNIKQSENSSNSFTIDYRDTVQKTLTPKEADYLVNLNDSKEQLNELNKTLVEKEAALDQLNIKKDELTMAGKEAELKTTMNSITVLSTEIDQLKAEAEQLQTSIDQYEGM